MSIFVIHAYDNENRGAYEMEDWTIQESTLNEAIETAREMSYEVITSYQDIYGELREQANDYAREDEDVLTYDQYLSRRDNYLNQLIEEAIGYEVTKLDDCYTLKEYLSFLNMKDYDYETLKEDFGKEEY